jgi:hypothetical protein
MSTTEITPTEDGRALAVARAEQATEAWRDVPRIQRWADPDHTDLYALAGELVGTLHAVEDLTAVLAGQVARYGTGRTLYDDTRAVDPAARLARAGAQLDAAREAIRMAESRFNEFWSSIGHVGVEVTT